MGIDVVTLALAKKYTRESLKGKSNLTPIDGTINIVDGKIGVKVSSIEDNLVSVKDDGLFAAVESLPIEKIIGLEDRLTTIENAAIGGVHYKGNVPTVADLPTDAVQGDLYEVTEDNSEWCFNGEEWFEYGHTVDFSPIAGSGIKVDGDKVSVKIADNSHGLVAVDGAMTMLLATATQDGAMSKEDKAFIDSISSTYASKAEMNAITQRVKYEVFSKPAGTTVKILDNEIRICCSANTAWTEQAVGANGNPNRFYIGLKIYAPAGADHFMEDLNKTIEDTTVFDFTDEFSGRDAYGNGYSLIWLPVAAKQENNTWKYYGDNSTENKMIGWYYTSAFYDIYNNLLSKETIRINLVNENMSTEVIPYYMNNYVTDVELETVISDISDKMSWGKL